MPTNRSLTRLQWVISVACLFVSAGCADSRLPDARAGGARAADQTATDGKIASESQDGVALGAGNTPLVIELGRVPMGSAHTRQVILNNGTDGPIRIDRFETSCECTSVAGLPVEIPAGEKRKLTITTDLAKDPNFTGGLAIKVELRAGEDVKGIVEIRCDVTAADQKPQA